MPVFQTCGYDLTTARKRGQSTVSRDVITASGTAADWMMLLTIRHWISRTRIITVLAIMRLGSWFGVIRIEVKYYGLCQI